MQAHEQKVHGRAALIRSLASKHNVKGYDHSPVEEDRATEFEYKLKDIHQRMTSGYEKLAATGAARTDTLSKNHLKLASQQTQHKVERDNLWQNVVCSYAISRCLQGKYFALDETPEQDLSRRVKAELCQHDPRGTEV